MNVVYAALGLLRDSKLEERIGLLRELAKHLESDHGPSELLANLNALDEPQKDAIEVEFIRRLLTSSELEWKQKLGFIRIHLLGIRLACDPFCDEEIGNERKLGDAARIEAERTFVDQSQTDWRDRSDRLIQNAQSHYRRAIECLESKYRKELADSATIDPTHNIPLEKHSELAARARSSTIEVLRSNIERLERERYGATEQERELIDRQLSWWQAAHSEVYPQSLAVSSSTLTLHGDSTLDLAARNLATSHISLRSTGKEPHETTIGACFDEESLEVSLDGNPLHSGASITIPKEVNLQQGIRVPYSVRNRVGKPSKRPLVLVATRGSDQRRFVVSVESPNDPMVSAQIANSNVVDSRCTDASCEIDPTLFANQLNDLAIAMSNLSPSSTTYQCRLLSVARSDISPPAGTVSLEDGNHWLEEAGGATELASAVPITLGAGECKAIAFPPGPPGNPCPIITRLVIEIRHESRKKVQFVAWSPQVLPPNRYLDSLAHYDSDRRAVDLSLRLLEESPISNLGTEVTVDVLDASTLEKAATSTIRLGDRLRKNQVSLSCVRCRTGRAVINLSVDGWASSFVYDLDLNRSGIYKPTRQLQALRLTSNQNSPVVAKQQSNVEVQVEVILSDDGFDESRDSIAVGLDRNGNRSLSDDVSLTLNQPRRIRFEWQGVGVNGLPVIRSVVENHRLAIPVDSNWNQWMSVMAVLRQGDKSHYSNAIPFVLDHLAPKIGFVRILGKQPCLLGSPVQVEIDIDDEGLSGSASVEGAWSTTGELELKSTDKTTPAVYRDANRWLLTITTEGMPSGKSPLLLRATDRSGNTCQTTFVMVEMRTKEEIDTFEAAIKTQVRGQAKYGSTPLQGMKLKLAPVVDDSKTPQDAKPLSDDPIASGVTQANGRFVLENVPSGKYALEISGIVRGMREKRTQEIVVDARGIPLDILLQMDKKP